MVELIPSHVPIAWHFGERDWLSTQRPQWLSLIAKALTDHDVVFVLDRPRRPIVLAHGLDRQHTAVLLHVQLHLPRLLDATHGRDAELFVQKLGSLARLALSAAVQKREYLRRRRPDLNRGFLLERARLIVTPTGLEEIVQQVETPGFAAQVLERLRKVLRQDGDACRLMTALETPTPVLSDVAEPDRIVDQIHRAWRRHDLAKVRVALAREHSLTKVPN